MKVFTQIESQYDPQTNLVRALVLAIGKYDTKYDSQCGSQMWVSMWPSDQPCQSFGISNQKIPLEEKQIYNLTDWKKTDLEFNRLIFWNSWKKQIWKLTDFKNNRLYQTP